MGLRPTGWLTIRGVAALLIILAAETAQAQQPFGLGGWSGGATVRINSSRTEGAERNTDVILYEETGNLGSSLYIIDPGLLTINFGGRLGYNQLRGDVENVDSDVWGYSVAGSVLPEARLRTTFFSGRNEGTNVGSFGSFSSGTTQDYGANFSLIEDALKSLGIWYFYSTLSLSHSERTQETRVLDNTFEQDQTSRVLNYRAHKGFPTADFDLRYTLDDVDQGEGREDFILHTVRLRYDMDFGPNLNRRWYSNLSYFDRQDGSSISGLSTSQNLRIDHYQNLSTNYGYGFGRSESDSGEVTRHSGNFSALHRLYDSLTENVGANVNFQDYPGGRNNSYGGSANLSYRRTLPWVSGILLANTSFGYDVQDSKGSASTIDVVDEPHTAPPVLGGRNGFFLDEPFVLDETIEVFDARGGALLPTERDVDYVVDVIGELTKIIPLDTSAVIEPGDPLLVSYTFEVPQNLEFSTLSFGVGTGIDFGWLSLDFSHSQQEQNRLSGRRAAPQFLTNTRTESAQVDMRGQWQGITARSNASFVLIDSSRVESTRWAFSQGFSVRPRRWVSFGLDASQSFSDFQVPDRNSEAYSVGSRANWRPLRGLGVSAFAAYRLFRDSELADEELQTVGVRIDWTYAKFRLFAGFSWQGRDNEDSFLTSLNVSRRFF